jgi:hypothetical protein
VKRNQQRDESGSVGDLGGHALIVLTRKRAWRDGLRGYAVLIDGEPIAKIRNGQRLVLPVKPGRHEVFLKISWCRSPSLHLDTEPGEVTELACEPRGPARGGLGDVLHAPGEYIRLVRV